MSYFWIIELIVICYTLAISTTYVEQLVNVLKGIRVATSRSIFLGSIFGWTIIITYLIHVSTH